MRFRQVPRMGNGSIPTPCTILCSWSHGRTFRRMLECPAMSKARAKKIKLILFDVDGVLTDGKIWIFPAPAGAEQSVLERTAEHAEKGGFAFHSQSLIEAKGFHAHDGTAISLARLG